MAYVDGSITDYTLNAISDSENKTLFTETTPLANGLFYPVNMRLFVPLKIPKNNGSMCRLSIQKMMVESLKAALQ